MQFEEKVAWVSLVVGVIVPATYLWVVLEDLRATSAADIAYQQPLLVAVGASIVLIILGAIATAIATAVESEVTGSGSIDEIDRTDERDVSIRRRGDLMGFYAGSVGFVAALGLTMLEAEYVWIATALYLAFVVASVVSSAVTIVGYRRGY
jgi:hypothetical protein